MSAPHSSRPARSGALARGLGRFGVGDLAQERAERAAELDRPAGRVALPERHPADLAGRGRDEHPVVGDVLDAPGRRAEQEHVADPRLVDHLLVELADAAARALAGGEEDAEQAAVGDGAAAGDGEPLRAARGRSARR